MKMLVVIGVVVLLAGLSLILNAFHIHLPLFRVAFGVALGWLGLSLVLSGLGVNRPWLAFGPHSTAASSTSIDARQDVLFANRELDVTHLQPGEHLKLGVIFGDATVRYDPGTPIELRASTAFGATAYPDGTSISFGERTLRTPSRHDVEPAVVEISTVFGNTRLVPVLP